MRNSIKFIAYRLTSKKIDEKELVPVHIYAENKDIGYFNLSSNRIIVVKKGDNVFYFRECPRIMDKETYFKHAVNQFFETLNTLNVEVNSFKQKNPVSTVFSEGEINKFRTYIEGKLNSTDFINTLSNADVFSEKIGFSIWEEHIDYDELFEKFGLMGIEDNIKNITVYFLWCMRSEAFQYRLMHITKGRDYSFFNAVRNVSSVIIADLLGLSCMITDYNWCVLHIDGNKELFGLISSEAKGARMKDCTVSADASLQRELNNLNVLDVILYQPDHGPNNYSIDTNDFGYCVCAFDNDNPQTLFPVPFLSKPFVGCAPFIDKRGYIARPFMDKEVAEKILSLDTKLLSGKLSQYLNWLQINILCKRINNLKRAIKRTVNKRKDFLLDSDGWNEQTVRYEAEKPYGETYFTKVINVKT